MLTYIGQIGSEVSKEFIYFEQKRPFFALISFKFDSFIVCISPLNYFFEFQFNITSAKPIVWCPSV